MLIEHGADPNFEMFDDSCPPTLTALDLAITRGHYSMAKMLIQRGAEVNRTLDRVELWHHSDKPHVQHNTRTKGQTLLAHTTQRGDTSGVQLLLAHGAVIDDRVLAAAARVSEEMSQLLIANVSAMPITVRLRLDEALQPKDRTFQVPDSLALTSRRIDVGKSTIKHTTVNDVRADIAKTLGIKSADSLALSINGTRLGFEDLITRIDKAGIVDGAELRVMNSAITVRLRLSDSVRRDSSRVVASPPTSLALATVRVGSGTTGRYARHAEAVPSTMLDARIEIAEAIKITPPHALALSIDGIRLRFEELNDLVVHRINAGDTEAVEVAVESSDITVPIRHVRCTLQAGELQAGEPRLFSMTVPTELIRVRRAPSETAAGWKYSRRGHRRLGLPECMQWSSWSTTTSCTSARNDRHSNPSAATFRDFRSRVCQELALPVHVPAFAVGGTQLTCNDLDKELAVLGITAGAEVTVDESVYRRAEKFAEEAATACQNRVDAAKQHLDAAQAQLDSALAARSSVLTSHSRQLDASLQAATGIPAAHRDLAADLFKLDIHAPASDRHKTRRITGFVTEVHPAISMELTEAQAASESYCGTAAASQISFAVQGVLMVHPVDVTDGTGVDGATPTDSTATLLATQESGAGVPALSAQRVGFTATFLCAGREPTDENNHYRSKSWDWNNEHDEYGDKVSPASCVDPLVSP